jgi:ketosteroid isomerase-like protein
MSRENVEIVRGLYRDFTRWPDPAAVAAVLERLRPDVEWRPAVTRSATGTSYRGHAGVRHWAEDMMEAWEDFRPEPIQFLDAGDRVVVDVCSRGRGRTSGIEVERMTTQVWTLGDGMVLRFETFTERPLALEAAGLSE